MHVIGHADVHGVYLLNRQQILQFVKGQAAGEIARQGLGPLDVPVIDRPNGHALSAGQHLCKPG